MAVRYGDAITPISPSADVERFYEEDLQVVRVPCGDHLDAGVHVPVVDGFAEKEVGQIGAGREHAGRPVRSNGDGVVADGGGVERP
jgi:hypothetical protein